MEDSDRYFEGIVKPTVAEFERNPTSVRHAFLACVAVFHSVDYRAFPQKGRSLRQKWRGESLDFALVDKLAHAFKHVKAREGGSELYAHSVVERPPGIPGRMIPGSSALGGPGMVSLADSPAVNVLTVVRGAVAFLEAHINGGK